MKAVIGIVLVILIGAGIWYYFDHKQNAEVMGDATVFSNSTGDMLTVVFGNEKAQVTLPDGSVVVLDQEPSGSGFLYTNGDYSLRGKGGDITLNTSEGTTVFSGTTVEPTVFQDESNSSISVVFAGEVAYVTDESGVQHTLVQEPSGSGFLYTGDGYELRGQGDEVILSQNGAPIFEGATEPEYESMTIYVASELTECTGVGPQTCMQYKEDIGSDEYSLLYDDIEGFEYEEGYQYVLSVHTEDVENPPADASSIRWVLDEEVAKIPVQDPEYDLTGVVWTWEDTAMSNDEVIAANPEGAFTVTFLGFGMYAMQVDCNRANGTYEQNGASLTINPGAMTRAACPPESSDSIFLDQIFKVATLVKNESALHLALIADAGIMNFVEGEEVVDTVEEMEDTE